MKRGFLLRAEGKKAAAKRRGVQTQQKESGPMNPASSKTASEPHQHRKRPNVENLDIAEKLAYGNLTDEQKALPSDYDPSKKYKIPIKESDPTITDFSDHTLVVTTVPGHSSPDDAAQCEWIVNGSTKGKVLNAPGYPAPIPNPHHPNMFEVESTPDMGLGLFAKRNIKRGDVFLAERPLLVYPRGIYALSKGPIPDHYTPQQYKQVLMFEYETLLEKTIERLPRENQVAFIALHNSHRGDGSGPLLGIMRSNGYGIDNLHDGSNETARYGAICKIASRVNHSCMPNVSQYFKLNSFSMQFYAARDIKAGEQLFYCYCDPDLDLVQRQAQIAPYGFVCKCLACVNATPETDTLRKTFKTQIDLIDKKVESSSGLDETLVENAVRLEQAMIKEGLDTEFQFVVLVTAICTAYTKLGEKAAARRYLMRAEALRGCYKDVGSSD